MRKSLLILAFFFCGGLLSAQNGVHSFIHISRIDGGLASNDVYDIVQDDRGFYWIATDNGLQRYDGKRWVRPAFGDPNSLPSKPVQQLLNKDNASLFVKMGQNFGVFNVRNFRYRRAQLNHPPSWNAETFLWQDSRNRIFLVFKGEGILLYDEAKNEFSQRNVPFNLPAGTEPYAIFEDKQKDHYWISANKGIYVFDNKNKNLYHSGYNPLGLPFLSDSGYKEVTSIFIDKNRNHWIVYSGGAQQFNGYSEKLQATIKEASRLPDYYKGKFHIDRLFQTFEEELWLFGRSALFNYVPQQKAFYNNKSDLLRNVGAQFSTVRNIMQDREKGIWIATDEGIYQTYTVMPEVRNVVFQTDRDDKNLTDVQELTNGEIWLSSRGSGIIATDSNHRNLKLNLYQGLDTLSNKALKLTNTLHQHSRTGKVWVGCDNGTLIIIDPLVRKSRSMAPVELQGQQITDIAESASGELIIGTAGGSIVRYDHRHENFHRLYEVKGAVNKLMIDGVQRLWIATSEGGLYTYDLIRQNLSSHFLSRLADPRTLSSNNVKSVVQLNDSIFAVATDVFELLNAKTGISTAITFEQGLLGNTVVGMQKDRQGHLWLATSNGICRYNFNRNKFTVYGQKDGFMKFETVGRSAAMFANGKIFFGGSNAFVTFPPHLFNMQEAPPAVTITDLRVLNSFLPLDSSSRNLELAYDNNSVSFYFSAMTYLNKDKLTYYYRLKGIDDRWVVADDQHAAIYTLLPSGNFTFEVRCENEDGISSPTTAFDFRIKPPFWKTWWFVMIVLSILAAVLYFLHRVRVNKILALSDLRNRVARDLHDDVGSTLSTISILSTMAKGKLIDNPVQAEQYIAKITDNSQQMMDAMDDIVWSIKPMNDSMQKIVARMREFASGALEPKDIDIDFFVDERVLNLKLNMEYRRDLFLIFKEAVNNIAKYSGASRVTIHFSYIRNRLMLKIKDNGIGFDVVSADSGNGLNNMKKRAAMLNGRIKLISEKDRGTLVLLNIPVN